MVKKINAQEFETKAKNSDVAVVDFSATWCGPCKMLAPVLEQVSDQLAGRVDFYNVDVDECPELAMEYAVKGMLPHNSIGDKAFTRLKVYAGSEHKQQAQKPTPYEVK